MVLAVVEAVEKTATVVIIVVITMVIIVVITMAVRVMAVVPMATEAMALLMALPMALPMVHHVQQHQHQLHLPSKQQVSSDWQSVIATGCQSLDLLRYETQNYINTDNNECIDRVQYTRHIIYR